MELQLSARDFDSAFARLFHDAYDVAFRILGDADDAEDAALDALTQAELRWTKIESLPYRDVWVMRAAVSAAIAKFRRRLSAPLPHNNGHDDNSVLRAAVVDAVVRLPRRDRDVLALRLIAGFGEADVAACLGMPVNSVKTCLTRALTNIRDRVGSDSSGAAAVVN